MGRNSYTDEFKKQIVLLYQNGKTILEIIKEYGMSKSAVYQWIEKLNNYGSFKAKDNRTVEENELDCLAERINPITNGKRHFKASDTDNRQKIEIINNNK